MRTRWRIVVGVAVLVAGVAVAATVAAQAPQTIRMAVVKATVLAPSLLAQKHLPPGWKTEITYFTTPGDMTNALLSDSVDLAYIGLTIAAVARSKDQPIVVVANQAGKGTAIVARTDSPIKSIADLKGKKIGNLPNSIHDILLREELRKANIKLDEVTLIRLAPADMPAALQRGDVDAFSGNEPNSTQAVMTGYGRVVMYPYDNPVGTINVGVLSSERVVKNKADMLRVWAQAHAKATDELSKNPDQWADLVTKEWGYDRAATRRSMDNIELKWQMDERFMSQMAAFTDRLKGLGVIQTIPDLNKLVVREFVGQVK
ncbi:MAG TPA: ABC transporter substrate-binding protein [Burkholderiales bacterium]|nr:ABC transporter substrate-binding protein [Burkholderiales bacterium]